MAPISLSPPPKSTVGPLSTGKSLSPQTPTNLINRPSFLLRHILTINTFSTPLTSLTRLTTPNPPKTESSGIWPLASYLNHSCLGTADRAFIGDLLIARATQDLPPNTELTWPYLPPDIGSESESDRRNKMLQNWGFECDCALCADAMGLGNRVARTRRALVEGVELSVEESF